MFKIQATEEKYSGIHPSGVRFRDGVAFTPSKELASQCAETGLVVTEVDEPAPQAPAGKKRKAEDGSR